MAYEFKCREVFDKQSGFTETDLKCVQDVINQIKGEIKLRKTGPRIEKGIITKPSRPLLLERPLEDYLNMFDAKRKQIEAKLYNSPRSSKGSNGGGNTIHTGPRGGKYIIHKNKKVYI